jgi:hypothetical protein
MESGDKKQWDEAAESWGSSSEAARIITRNI